MTGIDLDLLAARESEQIEWKENVADPDDVAATLCAFANDLANLGGGYVVCGAQEAKDTHGFPVLIRTGLDADRLREVEGKVLALCRDKLSPSIAPLTMEVPGETPDRRILVFIQPATGTAHSFQKARAGARHYVRLGRSTIEARNGILRELLVRKGIAAPWDRRACTTATVADIDLLALRDALQRMGVFAPERGIEPFLADDRPLSPFVPSLCVREAITGVVRPRNFAMLLFGHDVQRFIPGAVSLFSTYPGSDRSDPHAERHELAGPLIEQARRLRELLDIQSYTAFDKDDPATPNAVKYPKRALYEAIGNALAHRDYEMTEPTRVTAFSDRIEVRSPGSLPHGVDPDAFRRGKAAPSWRNQTLAWFFNRLQLAQAEGQGIPTILRTMAEEGCPPPAFEVTESSVTCVLPAHPRHAMLRDLRAVEQSIALGDLPRASAQVGRLIANDPLNARALALFAEIQRGLGEPAPIHDLVRANEERILELPAATLMQLGEALLSGEPPPATYRDLAHRLLLAATRGRIDERDFRRIGVALLRAHQHEAALNLVEQQLERHPEWQDGWSANQLRGDALLGLAGQCRRTAKRQDLPRESRQRAWRQFHDYLEAADRALRRAMSLAAGPEMVRIVQRNLDFLERLRSENQPRSGERR